MNTNISSSAPSQVETDCFVAVVLDQSDRDQSDKGQTKRTRPAKTNLSLPSPLLMTPSAPLQRMSSLAAKSLASLSKRRSCIAQPGLKAKRLLLLGGGKAKTFSASDLRKLAGAAVRTLKAKSIRSFAFALPETFHPERWTPFAPSSKAPFVGNFEPGYYKSDRKQRPKDRRAHHRRPRPMPKSLEPRSHAGRIVAESQNFTRDLVNEPSNRMTPTILAERAKKMAAEVGLKCEIYGPDKIKELKMGAFWGVAQGSDEPPALIVLRYEPEGAAKDVHLGLVGKGITFDTGGISIKPADGMEKMKYDMAGGATMIGAMRAIALLKPKVKVTAIICATENMPSGKAQKPGDVQIAMSGKSIEIINTDAEGRLVLADGLTYARQLGCTHLVDAATLTGAIVVALGYVNAGIFASDDQMYDRFAKALQAGW